MSCAQLGYRNAYLVDGRPEGIRRAVPQTGVAARRALVCGGIRQDRRLAHVLPGRRCRRALQQPRLPSRSNQPRPCPIRACPAWSIPAGSPSTLGKPDVRIIDVRAQPKYNTGHIPGAVCLNPESFRGVVGGVSSMLLPADMLARHMSLMGIRPTDTVVLVYGNVPGETDLGNGVRDATLVGMGLERLGHAKWAILDGGFAKWVSEKLPVTTALPDRHRQRVPCSRRPRWIHGGRQLREKPSWRSGDRDPRYAAGRLLPRRQVRRGPSGPYSRSGEPRLQRRIWRRTNNSSRWPNWRRRTRS